MTIYTNDQLLYSSEFALSNTSIDCQFDDSLFDFVVGSAYKMRLLTDVDELKQRIQHCILTETGEIPHHPDWGVGLSSLQNSIDVSLKSSLASKIRSQLLNKSYFPEITSVDSVIFVEENYQTGVTISIQTIYGVVTL